MTEMPEKKGKLKITLEVEVNEELMDLAKDADVQDAYEDAGNVEGARRKERVSASTMN